MSAGTLNVGSIDAPAGGATFEWTAGTINVTSAGGLTVAPGLGVGASLILEVGQTLGVTNTLTIGAGGEVTMTGGSLTASALAGAGHLEFESGTLTLTGNGSPAQYQQVLRTLTYDNNAAEPAFSERTMRITLSDEVGAGASAVNTISVEEPFNVNVARIGTNAGPQGGRTVTFVDADGTITVDELRLAQDGEIGP